MDELDTVDTLIVDLLEWMGPDPRPYAEVLEAWRTSCPRLPVWEDANDRGFIARHRAPGRGMVVSVSPAGLEHLRRHRQAATLEPAVLALLEQETRLGGDTRSRAPGSRRRA